MFKAAIRVNKITSIAQLRGATLHAERADDTSRARLREGAEPGAGLAWSKAPKSDRDYLAAYKAHKAELGAGERKGAPLCMQALCVVSPEWVKKGGDLHDPDNPHNRALFEQAKAWAESWAGEGSVFGARLDLDEAGGAVVDLMISPVRESRGKPIISTQKALTELKATTGERNEYSSLQTSWSNWARQTLDASIERGTRKTITDRQHLTPETYGAIKDKAREEVLRDLQHDKQDQALTNALQSASGLSVGALDDLRDLLLLKREMEAHRAAPEAYSPPQSFPLDESIQTHPTLPDITGSGWAMTWKVREGANNIIDIASRFGMDMDDDRKGYEPGKAFFPALTDRMHLTAVIAKCAEYCAKAEAFVKNLIAEAWDNPHRFDHHELWPEGASEAVERNERNLGLRMPPVTEKVPEPVQEPGIEQGEVAATATEPQTPAAEESSQQEPTHRARDDGIDWSH